MLKQIYINRIVLLNAINKFAGDTDENKFLLNFIITLLVLLKLILWIVFLED